MFIGALASLHEVAVRPCYVAPPAIAALSPLLSLRTPLPPAPQCVIVEPLLPGTDLAASLDMLAKLAVRVSGGGSVLQLVEEARRLTM